MDAQTPKQTDEGLALKLIAHIREEVSPEAVLLRDRIDRCLAYMDHVVSPNRVTLHHIRRYLDGTNDGTKG